MHVAELRMLHHAKNYEEIHSLIQQEMGKLALRDGTGTQDLDSLKLLVEEEMKRGLSAKSIPRPLVNIALLLGEDFEARVQGISVSYLAARYSADYQDFLNSRFQRLSSLRECFLWIEEALGSIALRYMNLPADWNLAAEVLLRLYTLTKQRMCDFFFYCEIDEPDFVDALDTTVRCEKRLAKVFKKSVCCVAAKGEVCAAQDGGCPVVSQEHCSHVAMLSSLFLPNIRVYLKTVFDSLLRSEFRQDEIEIYVISGFLGFFRSVGRVLKRIEYFGDKQAYEQLVQHFDSYLSILVRGIRMETELYKSVVVLNTLLFIQETADDFLGQILAAADVESSIPKTHAELRRVERFHSISVDEFFCRHLDADLETLSRKTIQLFEDHVMTEKMKGISEHLKISLLEAAVSCIFARISSARIGPEASEQLLLEVSELKRYLRTKSDVVPLIDVVEKYLKILLCPADDEICFVENFELLSEGIFSFEQIARNASCKDRDRLCSAYERRLAEF